MSLSPPSRTFTAPVSPAKPSALQVIPPTRHTASSVCCHQGGDCGVSRRGPADWRTASYIWLSGSWTPSRPCPPPLFYPTQHWTLTLNPPPPPTSPHIPRTPPPTHTYKLWPAPVTLCSIGLITTWFALYLPCVLCHFISLFFLFLQCPHLYICIVCMYICLNCIYLYLNVYCQCLMLTVCTKGLRVTQFQFSVCMCCTCGRIDNKADLTWLDLIYFDWLIN